MFIYLKGKTGPKRPLPDNVVISEPKAEEEITKPYSDVKGPRPVDINQQMPSQQVVPQ